MECLAHLNSLYVQGDTNTGKTSGVFKYLDENNYEYRYVSIQNIKNEASFKDLLYNKNVFNLLKQTKCSRALVIDNIDYLQNSDKKMLGVICKHLKSEQKKNENRELKYIFIGTNNHDKKVIELEQVVDKKIVFHKQFQGIETDKSIKESVGQLLTNPNIQSTRLCDKTIVSLVYHENVINYIDNDYKFYEQFLKSFSLGDYYDRISFQRQLWQFNEMTFYLKVAVNYEEFREKNIWKPTIDNEIIFTKILTKYSNEYSNLNFIISCCQRLNCQKYELLETISGENDDEQPHLTNLEMKRLRKILL